MQQFYDRKEEIFKWIQPYMDERFRESCQIIQEEVVARSHEIWEGLQTVIAELITYADSMQKHHQKGRIKYLAVSFLNYSLYSNCIEYRLDLLDGGFYLDEQEATEYYCPLFIQDRYRSDLEYFHDRILTEFKRAQEYEMQDVDVEYSKLYDAVIFKMIESMSLLIIETIKESGIYLAEDFKIIYGEYMDRAIILNTVEWKDEDEVFSDRDG